MTGVTQRDVQALGVTQRDVQALTYLARRLRDETHGAAPWDEAGTVAVVTRLKGQNLALSVERVTRHAADAGAKTPGAIERPFVPDAPVAGPPRAPRFDRSTETWRAEDVASPEIRKAKLAEARAAIKEDA